ncbi:MAG TPA: 4-hydroxybenzoate octaprenyltransferase [Geobacteraceae bacterium]|nr:4-hydroxybenzoate octaprenyltransferase [Geobacteraceae bacterium]
MFEKIKIFLEMIKFPHTVFALPFAFTGAVLAANGLPTGYQAFWILVAMVGARTGAMALNRLIDAEIDARNPRTRGRAIPAGLLGKGTVAAFIVFSLALFVYAAYRLNDLCLYLSPVAVILLVSYSYCKRFTSMSHLVLGLCLAVAPVGAWIAVKGVLEVPALLLGVGVLFWVAGFDVLYALQDLDFDRSAGLHSIPARLGVTCSLRIARLFHLVLPAVLLALFFMLNLGSIFVVGLLVIAALLAYEHGLLWGGDLAKLDAAFFNVNGYISTALFVFTLADVLLREGT